MALKNYTSQTPARNSILFIEQKLAVNGARQILKTYDVEGRVTAICFMMEISGLQVQFKVPARVEACQRVLEDNLSSKCKPETRRKVPAQAERTAWKILSDWVEAQMAMIELAQVDMMEVFLPYILPGAGEKTLYELSKENNFKKLLPGGGS